MNFSQGHSGTKVRYANRACFPKEKHTENSQKRAKFMNFSFGPFFGLVCRGDWQNQAGRKNTYNCLLKVCGEASPETALRGAPFFYTTLDGQYRQSPMARAQRTRSTLASHSAGSSTWNEPCPSFPWFFGGKQGKCQKYQGFSALAEPQKTPGKEGENPQKTKETPEGKRTKEIKKKTKEMKDRESYTKKSIVLRSESQHLLTNAAMPDFCVWERYDCQWTLVIRIAATTLASDSPVLAFLVFFFCWPILRKDFPWLFGCFRCFFSKVIVGSARDKNP